MPNVIEYEDYRDFFAAAFRQSKSKHLSYQKIASRLGAAKSYFKLLTDKKRHTTLQRVCKLSKVFNLDDFDHQYLVFLFLSNTTADESMQVYFRSVLSTMRGRRINEQLHAPVVSEQPSLFYDWTNIVILGLAKLPDYQDDPAWIHDRLGGDLVISRETIVATLQHLKKQGLLFERDGTWASEHHYHYPEPFDADGNRMFQAGLSRASTALKSKGKLPMRNSRFQMFFAAVSHEDAKQIGYLYDELLDKVRKIIDDTDAPERVVAISNNYYPVSYPQHTGP